MAHNELWNLRFLAFIDYVNMNKKAPPCNSKHYIWLSNQLSHRLKPYRARMLEEMAPGITNGRIRLCIELALRSGSKYIDKMDNSIDIYADSEVIEYQTNSDIDNLGVKAFGITGYSDFGQILYNESMGYVAPGTLDNLYKIAGVQKSVVENISTLLGNQS